MLTYFKKISFALLLTSFFLQMQYQNLIKKGNGFYSLMAKRQKVGAELTEKIFLKTVGL